MICIWVAGRLDQSMFFVLFFLRLHGNGSYSLFGCVIFFDVFPAASLTFPFRFAPFLLIVDLVQFGDSQQLRLVRILRSTVMVRVGGGWMALDEFLVKNDPCRGNLLSAWPQYKMNDSFLSLSVLIFYSHRAFCHH